MERSRWRCQGWFGPSGAGLAAFSLTAPGKGPPSAHPACEFDEKKTATAGGSRETRPTSFHLDV